MWQPEQPGLPVSAQMKPLYIAREIKPKSQNYEDPQIVSPEKESWRIEAYNDFMNMNIHKPLWTGKEYTYPNLNNPDYPVSVTLYPFEKPTTYPRFCISQNVDGQRHILSDDKEKLKKYLDWLRGIQSSIKGGKRTKRTKRTKRNRRTKRTKRMHSMKRK